MRRLPVPLVNRSGSKNREIRDSNGQGHDTLPAHIAADTQLNISEHFPQGFTLAAGQVQ